VTTALYPGSFDPLHLGHLAIIERTARVCDDVLVAVLGNPAKPSGMFAIPERIRMAEAATAHLGNVRCVGHQGLAVDAVRAEHADVLVRSGHRDTRYEWSMAAMNDALAEIPTLFVPPDPATSNISSSIVRQLVRHGEHDAALRLVPRAVRVAIEEQQTIPMNS
jgi:pantetheine-phosphate adenylyltransferase